MYFRLCVLTDQSLGYFCSVGLGLGLSAINSIGNGMRENRQENEIYRERVELEQARVKQAELEGRLRMLEAR